MKVIDGTILVFRMEIINNVIMRTWFALPDFTLPINGLHLEAKHQI